MKVLSTEGLTKLIQLVKETFLTKYEDTETVVEIPLQEATEVDLKTINGESIIGEGDIAATKITFMELS